MLLSINELIGIDDDGDVSVVGDVDCIMADAVWSRMLWGVSMMIYDCCNIILYDSNVNNRNNNTK